MSVEIPSEAPASRFDGLITYFSILFSPKAAFDRLSRVPTWGWAAVIGTLLVVIAVILFTPAQLHLTAAMQQKQLSQMSADQQAAFKANAAQIQAFSKIAIYVVSFISPWFVWLVGAVIYLIAAALSGGEAKFSKAWVLAVNAFVVWGIAGVINAIIVSLRDPSTVNSPLDIMSLPSLAPLAQGSPKLAAFLFGYNPLYIWAYIVVAIGLERMLKMSRTAAIVTVVVASLIAAGFGTLQAK
ncbi:MAG TPA: YIP1 family protein [Candidatus Eremiobacteraceae bacterium]|nr:YIP1 family protein [Candidatus Eremiobacteraceae bacterium]